MKESGNNTSKPQIKAKDRFNTAYKIGDKDQWTESEMTNGSNIFEFKHFRQRTELYLCSGPEEIAKLLEYALKQKDIIPEKKPWKNEFENLPIYDFKSFNEAKLFSNLLSDFQELGFVIVKNTSTEEGTVIKFAEMFGPVRTTNFGKHFDVVSKPEANDLAYTSLGIKAHTDNPYRKPMPGIQILHCISNEAKGGDSSLVDGYAVAEYLKINEPEMFEILTNTDVLFKFVDKDIILENYGKLIELDHNGKYLQSRFSGRLDYVPYLDPLQLEKFYAARKKLFHLYESEEFELNFRLDSGMLMMFDNIRVLHGRTEYDVNTGFRHLQGCYIDHDSTEGKLRRLKSNL